MHKNVFKKFQENKETHCFDQKAGTDTWEGLARQVQALSTPFSPGVSHTLHSLRGAEGKLA